ncbi:MAG: tetratricopeptide repeat protein [Acidobacteriota bacterium]|jgi:TolA-binding protein
MTKHRITRQEIKHDEFVSTVGRMTRWAEDNARTLLLGVAAALVLFLGIYGFLQWQRSRNLRAEAALAEVTAAYHGTVAGAQPGAESFASDAERYQAVVERADEVIAAYGSTSAADRARYYRGLALFDAGRLDEAAVALDEFLATSPDHFLAPFARWKKAQLLERRGDLAGACEGYRGLLDIQDPEFPNELAYLDLGRCLGDLGQEAEAADTYRRMLDAYPDSLYAADARQRLAELEAAAG